MSDEKRIYLQVPSGSQDGFDGPHTVIIVALRGQLLGAETVRGHNLHRERTSRYKTTGVQHDLCNQGIIRNHHGHGAEQGLSEQYKRCV